MDKVVDLLARYGGPPLLWHRAEVVGTAGYRTSGASTVTVDPGWGPVEVAYADGPEPSLGDHLLVRKANHLATSPWLAKPLRPIKQRHVPPLIVAGFDDSTKLQVILGRRDDNSWEVRGPNPYRSTSATLLTCITRQVTRAGDAFHLLYAFDDWSPGEGGKGGLGTNTFISHDDGATWEAAPLQGVIDSIYQVWAWSSSTRPNDPQGEGYFYLTDGGNTCIITSMTFAPGTGGFTTAASTKAPTLIDGVGQSYNLPMRGTANRIGGVSNAALTTGGFSYYAAMMLEAGGVGVQQFRVAGAGSPAGTAASFLGAYLGSYGLPWEGDHLVMNQGDGSSVANQYRGTARWQQPGDGTYRLIPGFTGPFGTNLFPVGPTLVTAAAASLPVTPSAWLNFPTPIGQRGTPQYFNMWRADRPLVYAAFGPNSAVLPIAILDGTEPVLAGGPPVHVNGAFHPPADFEEVVAGVFRGATIFPGPLPGEGSSPSYTYTRLLALVRLTPGVITLEDESGLLDLPEGSFTCQARRSVCATKDSSGSHWWSRWGA